MDTRDLIEDHFPFDGPHTPDSVAAAASCVDDLTRYLANATWPYKQVTKRAPRLRPVVAQLSNGLGHLPQVFQQIAAALDNIADDPSLFDDRRSAAFPGADTARAAADELRLAAQQTELLRSRLSAAGSHLWHLGHDTPTGGERQ